MNRRTLLLATLSLPLTAAAQNLGSLTQGLKDPLMSMLKSQLGVTEDQAKGGVGSYLLLAQENSPRATSTKSPRWFRAPRSTWTPRKNSAPSPAR